MAETIKPWIWKACQDYLSNTDPSRSIHEQSIPFRARNVQFLKFLSPHCRAGTGENQEPLWVRATDRHVSVYIHIPTDILLAFERDQQADKRRLSELSWPVCALGGCVWLWDRPSPIPPQQTRQLCLRLMGNLPKKQFKLKAELPFQLPFLSPSAPESAHGFTRIVSLELRMSKDTRGAIFLAAARLQAGQPRPASPTAAGSGQAPTEHDGSAQGKKHEITFLILELDISRCKSCHPRL